MATKTEIKDRLFRLYERALIDATSEALAGFDGHEDFDEQAAQRERLDAALKEEFIGFLGMLEAA